MQRAIAKKSRHPAVSPAISRSDSGSMIPILSARFRSSPMILPLRCRSRRDIVREKAMDWGRLLSCPVDQFNHAAELLDALWGTGIESGDVVLQAEIAKTNDCFRDLLVFAGDRIRPHTEITRHRNVA